DQRWSTLAISALSCRQDQQERKNKGARWRHGGYVIITFLRVVSRLLHRRDVNNLDTTLLHQSSLHRHGLGHLVDENFSSRLVVLHSHHHIDVALVGDEADGIPSLGAL